MRRRGWIVVGVLAMVAVLSTAATAATPGKNGRLLFVSDDALGISDADPATDDEVRFLTTGVDSQDVAWSSDGTRIVLTVTNSSNSGFDQVATIRADGTGFKRLTPTSMDAGRGTWSPDGTRIVFDRYQGADEDERERLMVMNADGTGITPLTDPPAGHYHYRPMWSPDGRTIAYVRETPTATDIWLVDADGSHPRPLADSTSDEEYPAWSPDGTRVAYERDGDIWIVSIGGSAQTFVNDAFRPEWSPDGTKVIYTAIRSMTAGPSPTNGIFRRLANGTGDEVLISHGEGEFDAAWQPRCNLVGTNGPDTLTGTAKPELICGKGGGDTLGGKGGLDIVFGSGGRDRISGGDGPDVLVGGDGDDRLSGQRGPDRLLGQGGDDPLDGGPGMDVCLQGPGSAGRVRCES